MKKVFVNTHVYITLGSMQIELKAKQVKYNMPDVVAGELIGRGYASENSQPTAESVIAANLLQKRVGAVYHDPDDVITQAELDEWVGVGANEVLARRGG